MNTDAQNAANDHFADFAMELDAMGRPDLDPEDRRFVDESHIHPKQH